MEKKEHDVFYKIPNESKYDLLPVLITNNHLIDEMELKKDKHNLFIIIMDI